MTVCVLGLATIVSAHAAETYKIFNAGGFVPKIDGKLADWEMVETGVALETFTEFDGGKWNGKQDASGMFWLTWTDEGLYFAAKITDDEHINTMIGDQIWNGDSIQIMIEPTGERAVGNGVAYEFNFGLGGAKSDAPQFSRALAHAKAGLDHFCKFEFDRDEATKSTIYEVLFTKADLVPAQWKAGTTIGFALIVNDGDKGQEGQKGWLGWAENAIVFGKKPDQTNFVELLSDTLAVDAKGKLTTSWGDLKR